MTEPEARILNARVMLCAAANRGLAEHATRPQLIPRVLPNAGKTTDAVEAIEAAGVPTAFAESAIYELARGHNADGAVTSLKYFVPDVIRRWEQSKATADAGSLDPRPTARTEDSTGGASVILGRIRKLIETSQNPGQAPVRFIRRAAIEAEGLDVVEAYDAIGGSERIVGTSGENWGFLIRDFDKALDAVRRARVASAVGPGASRDRERQLTPSAVQ